MAGLGRTLVKSAKKVTSAEDILKMFRKNIENWIINIVTFIQCVVYSGRLVFMERMSFGVTQLSERGSKQFGLIWTALSIPQGCFRADPWKRVNLHLSRMNFLLSQIN